MLHQPWGSIHGTESDIQIEAKEMAVVKKACINVIVDATGKKYEQVEKDMDRNLYFGAKESVSYGLADHIIPKKTKIKSK